MAATVVAQVEQIYRVCLLGPDGVPYLCETFDTAEQATAWLTTQLADAAEGE